MNNHPALVVIDRWLTYQAQTSSLPGFQMSIRHKSNLIFSKAYGTSDLSRHTPFTPRHLCRIASHSKVFTSSLTLLFESQNRLKLSDNIIKYLPELTRHRDIRFRKITIEHLLTNRSGIYRDGFDTNFWGLKTPFPTSETLIKEIFKTELIYSPGRLTKYSNIGFGLLGLVLERIGQSDYNTLVTTHILKKLRGTALTPEFSRANVAKFATGHTRSESYRALGKPLKHSVTKALSPATGFCGTADSLTDFFQKLYQTDLILPKRARNKLLRYSHPVANLPATRYGLGTIFTKMGGDRDQGKNQQTYIGHSGGYPGFSSQSWMLKGSNLFMSFITNSCVSEIFNVRRAIFEIFNLIEDTFAPGEWPSLIISQPMADFFESTIYIKGKSKAIAMPLNGWLPTASVNVYRKQRGQYLCDKLSGFLNIGEPLIFHLKGKQIAAVEQGGFVSYSKRQTISSRRVSKL